MRAGAVYRFKLSPDGRSVQGGPIEYFRALDRYRDLAISPDGQRVFLVTDSFGTAVDADGRFTSALEHPGALIEFTFVPESRARQ
jgi:hypothetical protein